MKILFVDDDIQHIHKLTDDFSKYFQFMRNDINMIVKTEDFFNLDFDQIDIAFLDIDLKTGNGIDLANKLKQKYPQIILIFISAKEDLVFKTLATGIFQFIRKSKYEQDIPVVFEQLKNYFKDYLNKKVITYNGRKLLICIDEIEYIIALGHECVIHTQSQDYTLHLPMQEVLDLLSSVSLIQIQRNLAINFRHVKKISKTKIITTHNTEYEVGRKYRINLLDKYEEYLLR